MIGGKGKADFAVSESYGHKNSFVQVRRSWSSQYGKLLPSLSLVNWWRVRAAAAVGVILIYFITPVIASHFIDWAALELG
jgi:hypothetical protein